MNRDNIKKANATLLSLINDINSAALKFGDGVNVGDGERYRCHDKARVAFNHMYNLADQIRTAIALNSQLLDETDKEGGD